MAKPGKTIDGPDVDRTMTLTDGVVAIAMTLLILPVVEMVNDLDVDNLSTLVSLVSPRIGMYLLLLLFVTGRIEARSADLHQPGPEA